MLWCGRGRVEECRDDESGDTSGGGDAEGDDEGDRGRGEGV